MKTDFKNDTAGCTYKKGIVAAAKPGFARVRFDDLDGMTSDWLPTSHANTQNDKEVETLNVGAQVSCLMDARMEDGCIIGAHYSDADAPPVQDSNKWVKKFSDGTVIQYDKGSKSLTVTIEGTVYTLAKAGMDVQNGGVTSTGDQVAGGISQMSHTHGGVASGSARTSTP